MENPAAFEGLITQTICSLITLNPVSAVVCERRREWNYKRSSLKPAGDKTLTVGSIEWVQDGSRSSLECNPQCVCAAGWEGPPPPRGCEVFVGKIPRDMYEDELVPLFETAGRMYEFRLMMEFSGENRGYAFVMYTNRWLWAVQHAKLHLKHGMKTVVNKVLLVTDCGAERRLRGPSRCWTTTRSARGSSSACAWVWTTAASSSAPSPKTRGRTRSWRRWSRYQHRQNTAFSFMFDWAVGTNR